MTSTHTVVLYVTTPTIEEAQKIAQSLVGEHLVACANIFSPMQSYFNWKNTVQHENEIPMFLKTTEANMNQVVQKIKELHSYELPCIISFPITGGFTPFIDWIRKECKQQNS